MPKAYHVEVVGRVIGPLACAAKWLLRLGGHDVLDATNRGPKTIRMNASRLLFPTVALASLMLGCTTGDQTDSQNPNDRPKAMETIDSPTPKSELLERLKTELKNAIRSHYKQLTESVPDVYGYSLFTSDGVHSLGPVANRTSAIKVGTSDRMYNYYRYLAVEWSEWDDFGLFGVVNGIVSEIHADESVEFSERREAILRVSLEAMCELESEGVFGPRTSDRFVVICLADSSEPTMMKSAKLLNTPEVFEAYASQF